MRARLAKIPMARQNLIKQQEPCGETIRDIRVEKQNIPKVIKIPHEDYCYYNKARKGIVYAPPAHAIFWHNGGDTVYTYKKKRQLVFERYGRQEIFFCEGITWNLISSRLHLRYLPSGYVLDNGAPCALLNPCVDKDEMFFILAWGLSDLCNKILKTTINHTKNIQSKDFERLPYPFGVSGAEKLAVITRIKAMIKDAQNGDKIDYADTRIYEINAVFEGGNEFGERNNIVAEQRTQTLFAING